MEFEPPGLIFIVSSFCLSATEDRTSDLGLMKTLLYH